MAEQRCPNPYCKGGWVERGDNESGGAPAFQCRAEGCPYGSSGASRSTVGRRIPDGQWFAYPRQAGDYGAVEVEGQGWRWFNRPPNAEAGDPDHVLNENHVVVIELDGTITVHASIENRVYMSDQIGGAGPISTRVRPWHGHLERGVWREV